MQYENVRFYAYLKPSNMDAFLNSYWYGEWKDAGIGSVVDKCFDIVKIEFYDTDSLSAISKYGEVEMNSYTFGGGNAIQIESLENIDEKINHMVGFTKKWGF